MQPQAFQHPHSVAARTSAEGHPYARYSNIACSDPAQRRAHASAECTRHIRQRLQAQANLGGILLHMLTCLICTCLCHACASASNRKPLTCRLQSVQPKVAAFVHSRLDSSSAYLSGSGNAFNPHSLRHLEASDMCQLGRWLADKISMFSSGHASALLQVDPRPEVTLMLNLACCRMLTHQ